MENFKSITPKELNKNPFTLIGNQHMLITSGKESNWNTMTASWGSLGFLWNKPIATIFVRPQRYTFEFLEKNSSFSLSFFPEEFREDLVYCGKHSGREEDKIKHTNLTPISLDHDFLGFQEAELTLCCKTLYETPLNPSDFLQPELIQSYYPKKDFHRVFVGEIQNIYKQSKN